MQATRKRRKQHRKPKRSPIGSLLLAARERRKQTRTEAAGVIGCVHSSLKNWEEYGLRPLAAYVRGIASYVGVAGEEIERLRGQLRKVTK